LISADGVFLGGAILPGIGTSARALHEFTDLLPLLAMHELRELPPALGTGTCEALRSGLFWGTIGAVRELIDRLGQTAGQTPQVVLTGGAAPAVAGLLQTSAEYMQNLTLAGIALSAK
jgi:type III pantothenate kinase